MAFIKVEGGVTPFVKWAGRKSRQLKKLLPLVPQDFEVYVEPFVGSGALYFSIGQRAKRCYINDSNTELINAYLQLRDNLQPLKELLRTYVYDKDFYLEIRDRDRDPNFPHSDPLARAARFIYLMKTCFNGLYRVNRYNQFNVPFGRYENPLICDDELLDAVSAYLNRVPTEISAGDYEASGRLAGKGVFYYLDPPYMPVSMTSFTSYQTNSRNWAGRAQYELANFCRRLDWKGARFMVSNSDTPELREWFAGFNIRELSVARMISPTPSRRGTSSELVITNY